MTTEQIKQAAEKIRLIALDIDGTSVNSVGEITEDTRETIQELICAGYIVVPATGRGFYGLREQIGVEGIRYVISADGAVVTDGLSGEILMKVVIPRERAALLAEELQNDKNCIYLHLDDPLSTHMAAYKNEKIYLQYKSKGFLPSQNIFCGEMKDYVLQESREVLKMGLRFEEGDRFQKYESAIEKKFPDINGFRVDASAMEFTASGASKATALRALCAILKIRPEQVCAIGDNGNDIMLPVVMMKMVFQNSLKIF